MSCWRRRLPIDAITANVAIPCTAIARIRNHQLPVASEMIAPTTTAAARVKPMSRRVPEVIRSGCPLDAEVKRQWISAG